MTKLYPTLRITDPVSRYNDDLVLDSSQRQLLMKNIEHFRNKNFQDPRIPGNHTDQETWFFMPGMRSSLVYVVTETVGDYPYPYLTEKTWKAIVTGMPFMIIGGQGSLKLLQSFGFKTFGEWWDESYDCLPNVADRIDKIVRELKKLNDLSLDDLSTIKKQMISVLEHNQTHLSEFRKKDLDNIRNNL